MQLGVNPKILFKCFGKKAVLNIHSYNVINIYIYNKLYSYYFIDFIFFEGKKVNLMQILLKRIDLF